MIFNILLIPLNLVACHLIGDSRLEPSELLRFISALRRGLSDTAGIIGGIGLC
jgi:hypothetical protein